MCELFICVHRAAEKQQAINHVEKLFEDSKELVNNVVISMCDSRNCYSAS